MKSNGTNYAEWNILVTDTSTASSFAANEFVRLISRMDPMCIAQIKQLQCCSEEENALLKIGVDSENLETLSTNKYSDDAIRISVKNCTGVIAGSNPRSVLIAVYRFFTECGCGFVRPGRDGEFIPGGNSTKLAVEVCEKASYRHRGICIEGAVSYENVVQMIDWAPKVGFNSYFTQFFTPFEFFDRWYSHHTNPRLVSTPISPDTVNQFVCDYTAELEKRGMLQHGVGHGWTPSVLGLSGLGWNATEEKIPEEKKELVALVEGERTLWHGVPLNTNLCYSNPKVKSFLAQEVVNYVQSHPQIDYLHFWLGDSVNSQCECNACRSARPADFYVDILNMIDARLTEKKLKTKIVFLLYFELLWAPEKARIKNPERFTLMFAPITRTYSEPLNKDAKGSIFPYTRNKVELPKSVGDSLAYLNTWQKQFSGDSFIFDYHYMWDHYKDPGYYQMADVLKCDIENLHDIGLNGYVSCQVQRAFLPNGLGMYLMGNTLWQGKTDFECAAADYFQKAYGEDGEQCRAYLKKVSELFDPQSLRREKEAFGEEKACKYETLSVLIEQFMPVIQKNMFVEDLCRKCSWENLKFHGELCQHLTGVLAARAKKNKHDMKERWVKTRDFVCENEWKYQPFFDVMTFIHTWEQHILTI